MNGHGGKRPGAGRPTGTASRANEQVRQEAAATGELPLAYMLRIMRDRSQPVGRRDDMAKAAAPFCHSRFLSVEHSGEIARPTVIRAPAVSATPTSGSRNTCRVMADGKTAGTACTIRCEPQPGPHLACPVFEVFFGGARVASRTTIIALPSRWRTSRERFGHQIRREVGTMWPPSCVTVRAP